MEFAVKGGEGVGVMPKADAILVQSIEPVTLAYVHNGSLLRTIYQDVPTVQESHTLG